MPTAYIGMGANIPSPAGPPPATLAGAAESLSTLGQVVCRSSLYSTAPVGFSDQPRFVNAVVELQTQLSPAALLAGLLRIEREFGRDRTAAVPNGPRTLDLDILLYGDFVLHQADLDIPHPRLAERKFALIPLHEIASKGLVVPGHGSVTQLLEGLGVRFPSENDEVTLLPSDVWRAGPGGHNDDAPSFPEPAEPASNG